ncbi:MAG: hypothetical protein OXR62_12185 [Ahrensia sp.]|nr:hypothetical protein [Ahrensia sp.]
MSIGNAFMTFALGLSLVIGGVLGMSPLVDTDAEAARNGGGYGIASTL